jgi:thiol-disulfide isomerase/thioredoxin
MRELGKSFSLILIFLIAIPLCVVFTPMAPTAYPAFSGEEPPLYATTQRIVLAELFTATWCGFCPYATRAINELADQYGSSRLVVLQYHPKDGYDPLQ